MKLFMETTQIPTEKTVGEIQEKLGLYGASAIMVEYANKQVSAVSFKIKIGEKEVPFRLPCRWESVLKLLKRNMSARTRRTIDDIEAQAKRVAWRQILRWVEAQMALVETNMVTIEEVFLPYVQTGVNQTLYEKLVTTNFKLLN